MEYQFYSFSTPTFDLPALYAAAGYFNFVVDTRGVYPVMIDGLRAAVYTKHEDMVNFVSKESK